MQCKCKGSISLTCLLLSLLLILLATPVLLWLGREAAQEREFLRGQQLRLLCGTVLKNKSRQLVPAGSYVWYDGVLQPGAEGVQVTAASSYSNDGLLNYLEVAARPAKQSGAVQRLHRLKISFSEAQQHLAGRCVLVAQTLKGAEYLPAGAIYIQASEEEVKLPQFSFLAGKAASNLTTNDIAVTGVSANCYYLPSGTLKVAAKQKVHGTSVIVNKSGISIGAEAHFPERVVLASESSSITLNQNVRMDKALVMAKGTVTIAAGCNIQGLVIAKQIILQGASTFKPDTEVLSEFTTPFYPNL